MSENRKDENNSFSNKTHTAENLAKFKEIARNRTIEPRFGYFVEVLDLKTNETKIYKFFPPPLSFCFLYLFSK